MTSSANPAAPATPADAPARPLHSAGDLAEACASLLARGTREVCCADRDGRLFELSSAAVVARLHALVCTHRRAAILLLVDDGDWVARDAARLNRLHRSFSHAVRVRLASPDDPVGDARFLVVDQRHAIDARPTRHGAAVLAVESPALASRLRRSFEHRWERARYDLSVTPLGL